MRCNVLLVCLALIPLVLASLADAQRGSEVISGAPTERSSPIDEFLAQVEHFPTTLQPRASTYGPQRLDDDLFERDEVYHPDESYQGKTAPRPPPHHGIIIPRPANNCYLPGGNGKMYHICRSPNRSCPLECQKSAPPYAPPKPNSPPKSDSP